MACETEMKRGLEWQKNQQHDVGGEQNGGEQQINQHEERVGWWDPERPPAAS